MSAQPYLRPRPPRRDRDAELERLVAAELDACEAPLDTLIESPVPANVAWPAELSAAERDFVDLVRRWLDRRPNKHQLLQLICDADAPAPQPPARAAPASAVEESQPDSSAEPDSHVAP